VREQDRSEIIQTIDLYGFAIDARRWDLFDEIFTSDVEAHYSSGGHWKSLVEWKTDFEAAHQPFYHTQHAMLSHLVAVDGNEAKALTYVSWRLVLRNTDGDDLREGTAWYDDDLIRTDRGWRIRRRNCQVCWAERRQISAEKVAEMSRETPIRQLCEVAAEGGVAYFEDG